MMSLMLYLLMFVRSVISVDNNMEIMDKTYVGQLLNIRCPIKEIDESGLFWWSFEPLYSKELLIICKKNLNDNNCVKLPKKDDSKSFLNTIEMQLFNIVIGKSKPEHTGTYQCKYITAQGIKRYFIKVNILTPPGKPLIHTSPRTLTENVLVKLTCISEGGNPKATLKWLWKDFTNTMLSKERRINSTFIQSSVSFGISNLTSIWLPISNEDGNSICCEATNSLARVRSNWMYLNINYRPVIYDFPSQPYYGLLGGELSIECKATSKSTATFKWTNNKGLVISDGSYLIINSLQSSNKGAYSCVVTNSIGTSSATLEIKVLSAPIITVESSVFVKEWENLNLKCDVVPIFSNVTWWLEDKLLSNTNELNYNFSERTSFNIQCRASVYLKLFGGQKNYANSMKSITITVQHIPRKPSISANPNGMLLTGSDVTMTCIANRTKPGLPKSDYYWRKENSQWTRNGTNFITLNSLKFDNSGTYYCKMFNKLGSSEESFYTLFVEGQPIPYELQTDFPKRLFARVGKSFKIECLFQGNPIPIIRWYSNDDLIQVKQNSSRHYMESSSQNGSWLNSILYMKEPDIQSEERYRCIGENKYGSISQEFLVRIIYPPKMISNVYILAANITGMLPYKESVHLNCSVMASPKITISWIRKLVNYNEKIIENETDKYMIMEKKLKTISGIESILYIKNFQNEDYGRYLCFAKNTEGHIETNFDIRKYSIPDPAHDLKVDGKSWNSLTLKWKSGFDGGYPQIFTVSYLTEMQKLPIQIRTIHSNITLKNLLPDVFYTINITASNEIGTGTSTLSTKVKTSELMVEREQLFSVNKEDRIIEFNLPSNLSSSIFCLTIEQMDTQKDLIGDWIPFQRCIKNDIKTIKIDNPYDRFRIRICLINLPEVCSGPIIHRSEPIGSDTLVSTRLIGTVAAICTALVIVLAILLFFILIRSRRFLPVISDLKVMKRNRKSSYSKDDSNNFNTKLSTPICPKKQSFLKESGECPLLSTYSCDQVHINGNPIQILNVCPPHNVYMEGLYSTLVKSSSISPFPYDLTQPGTVNQPSLNSVSSCCCHDDQQVFNMSLPASKNVKPEKIIYEVMV